LLTPKNEIIGSLTVGGLGAALLFASSIPTLNLMLLPLFAMGLYALSYALPYALPYALSDIKHSHKVLKIGTWLITLLLGFFIAIYRPANFNYPLIFQTKELYEGGQSFSLYANTSKALGGYLVVLWLLAYSTAGKNQRSLPRSIMFAIAAITCVLFIANVFFHVQWQPKLPEGLLYFIVVNLGISVVAEEAFFRLLIHDQIVSFFSNKRAGMWVGASAATVLFALSHTASIGAAFLLFFIAGATYSAVYIFSGRLSMAICVHFGVNILHVLLLEYPLSI
ncbi:MAG: membrane protease YdiL (CAAX protease family), partial [Lentisphaeria bacterium]